MLSCLTESAEVLYQFCPSPETTEFLVISKTRTTRTRTRKNMMKRDHQRHYLNIKLTKNTAKHSAAPEFIRHSISSEYLNDYIRNCVETNRPVTFDIAAFAVKNSEDDLVITISVPHFEKRRPTNLIDLFVEETEQ